MLSRLFIGLALAWPIASAAQSSAPLAQPADATASVPQLRYDSPFRGYRRYADTKLSSWRELNADVLNAASSTSGAQAATGQQPAAELNARKPAAHRH